MAAAFVDTSALYALLDESDANHRAAVEDLGRLRGRELVTHAYVVVEAVALTGRRLGWPAIERLLDTFLPLVDVRTVDDALHEAAMLAYRESGSDRVSLVDRVSFAFMRRHRLSDAFAFDADFEREGFAVIAPSGGDSETLT